MIKVETEYGTFILNRIQLSKLHNAFIQAEHMYYEYGEFRRSEEVKKVKSKLWNKLLELKCERESE